jgi:nucleotide-binding universal stress UspA family protein
MFNAIVAGVDGSPTSLRALKYASGLAESYGAHLVVVHAYPHTSDLRDHTAYDKLLARRKGMGQKVLDDARQQLGEQNAAVEEDLLEGPAANAILKVAETRNADLVVLGSRGMGSLNRWVFGSVSSKVMHCAPCTVMVVR